VARAYFAWVHVAEFTHNFTVKKGARGRLSRLAVCKHPQQWAQCGVEVPTSAPTPITVHMSDGEAGYPRRERSDSAGHGLSAKARKRSKASSDWIPAASRKIGIGVPAFTWCTIQVVRIRRA
jgi:hypothetical protein